MPRLAPPNPASQSSASVSRSSPVVTSSSRLTTGLYDSCLAVHFVVSAHAASARRLTKGSIVSVPSAIGRLTARDATRVCRDESIWYPRQDSNPPDAFVLGWRIGRPRGRVDQGWEFYRVEKVQINVTPTGMAALGGVRSELISFDQVVFRRPR